jgi:hypothetical protein
VRFRQLGLLIHLCNLRDQRAAMPIARGDEARRNIVAEKGNRGSVRAVADG